MESLPKTCCLLLTQIALKVATLHSKLIQINELCVIMIYLIYLSENNAKIQKAIRPCNCKFKLSLLTFLCHTVVNKDTVTKPRRSDPPAPEMSTVQNIDEKISVRLKSADRPEQSYMNVSAVGTQQRPVRFDVDGAISSLKKRLRPYIVDSKKLQLDEVIGKG